MKNVLKTSAALFSCLFLAPGLGCAPSDEGSTGSGEGPRGSGGTVQSGSGGEGTGSGAANGSGGGGNGGGSGGTDGSSGGDGSGGTGGSTSEGGCAAAVICDDFEDGLDPSWSVQEGGQTMPVVDTTKGANGSASSLRVVGDATQSFILREVPGQVFYARAFMNFAEATTAHQTHRWFIVGADNPTQGDQNQIRFGVSAKDGVVMADLNVYDPQGGGGEKTQFSNGSSNGAAGWENVTDEPLQFEPDRWYCVEVLFDGPGHEFRIWVDGMEHQGLHVTEATMVPGWAPVYTHVKFGAGNQSAEVWFDDVAVSTERVGCDP